MKKYTVILSLVLFMFGLIVNGIWSVKPVRSNEPNRLKRQHLLSLTGSGSTEGGSIPLYIDGITGEPPVGDQRITITGEMTFRMCVITTSDEYAVALDIVGVRQDSQGRIQRRTVERLPMSDLRDEKGVQFKTDPGLIAGLFIDDPVVFKLRVTGLREGPTFTMNINYLKNYDEEVRNTLVVHALTGEENWTLVRQEPVAHEIKTVLHLVNRSDVNGVRIKTEPVNYGASLKSNMYGWIGEKGAE